MTGMRLLALGLFCAQATGALADDAEPAANISLKVKFAVIACERESRDSSTDCAVGFESDRTADIVLDHCTVAEGNKECWGVIEERDEGHGLAFGSAVKVTKIEDKSGRARYFLKAWIGNGRFVDYERWTSASVQLNKTGNLSNPLTLTSAHVAIDYPDGGMRSFYPMLEIKAK